MAAVRFRREEGWNVFSFDVEDPDYAFNALLNVPELLTTGVVHFDGDEKSHIEWSEYFTTFVICGFPRTNLREAFKPQLMKGGHACIGAVYSYTFALNEFRDEVVSGRTRIANIEERADFKEIVFAHHNEALRNSYSGCCRVSPLPYVDTETRARIINTTEDSWEVQLWHNGASAIDPIERDGECSIRCGGALIMLLMPCLWPCLPCFIADAFSVPNVVREQIGRVKEYCSPQTTPVEGNEQDQNRRGGGDASISIEAGEYRSDDKKGNKSVMVAKDI